MCKLMVISKVISLSLELVITGSKEREITDA